MFTDISAWMRKGGGMVRGRVSTRGLPLPLIEILYRLPVGYTIHYTASRLCSYDCFSRDLIKTNAK